MLRIFDFMCTNGHVFEVFVTPETNQAHCSECGELAGKIISPVKCMLDPVSGSFPGATMKWARDREQKIKKERRAS